MSITITGGFTMAGGGFTLVAAPPSDNTAGWWAGGTASIGYPWPPMSTVQRITFATDTTTASVRGPLTQSIFRSTGSGNSINGYFGAGLSYQPYGLQSTVQRITYATDTATASSRGPLASAAYSMATCSGAQ